MKSAIYVVFLAGMAGLAAAQNLPTLTAQMNTVYVGSEGKFEAQPDTAVLRFDVAAQETTSRAAYDKAAAAAERVRAALKANGIDPKAAQVGFYSVQPMYDWKNPKRRIVGYRVTTDITLKLHDFSKIGPITEQTADIEEMQNQSLNYTLENIEVAKQKATEDAFMKAREQAATVTRAGGRTLGELLYASVDVTQQAMPLVYSPSAMMRANVAGAAPAPTAEFTPQSVTITAHVNALFGMK